MVEETRNENGTFKKGRKETPEEYAQRMIAIKKWYDAHPERHKKEKIIKPKYMGHAQTLETREKISKTLSANPNVGAYAREHPEEHRANASRAGKMNKGIKQKPRTISEKYREAHREARLRQIFPRKDNKLEQRVGQMLRDAGFKYEKHKAVIGQPDFYIPSLNLAIFTDGCYWHGCHECKDIDNRKPSPQVDRIKKNRYTDYRIKHELELEGYNVMRLWAHEINKPDFDIKKVISRHHNINKEVAYA